MRAEPALQRRTPHATLSLEPPPKKRPGRVNPPLKSFLLFLAVLGLAWVAYEFVYVRKIFQGGEEVFIDEAQREMIRDKILERYASDPCFLELGSLLYRPKENSYRVEIRVGYGCSERARRICEEVSVLVGDTVEQKASVWALDSAGNVVAHFVP
jgi:hypothetical protein